MQRGIISKIHDVQFSGAIFNNQAALIDGCSDLSKTKRMESIRRRRGKKERTKEEWEDIARLKAAWEKYANGRMQKDLAAVYGKSEGAVSQYFTGETAVNWPFLRVVSEFLHIDPSEISPRLAEENMIGTARTPKPFAFAAAIGGLGQEIINAIPYHSELPARQVLAEVIAGNFQDAKAARTPGDEPWYERPSYARSSDSAAWLIVVGDSMDDGSPKAFREGDLILVDPDASWESGDFVIIANGGNEWTFKRIRKDGPTWYMEALNPGYQPRVREIPPNWRVVAKVLEVKPKGWKVG